MLFVCTKQPGAGKLTQQLSTSSHLFRTVLCYLCARSSVELAEQLIRGEAALRWAHFPFRRASCS